MYSDVLTAFNQLTLLMVFLLLSHLTISRDNGETALNSVASAQQTALPTASPPEIGVKITSPTSGDSLNYLWKQTDDSVEKVNIENANEALANFRVPDKLGDDTTFELTLTVTDKYGETATNSVSLEAIANSEPVADTGGDKEAAKGEQVTLDGTGSHDPDPNGKIVSYRWEQTDGPSISLQGSNQPIASFSVPRVEDTTFEFTLTVTDDEGAESKDGAEVQVDAPPQPKLPNESGEVCLDEIDNNGNGLVDEECESD